MVRDRAPVCNHTIGVAGVAEPGFAFATFGFLFFLPRLIVVRTFAPTHAAALATAVRIFDLGFAPFLDFAARFLVLAFGRALTPPALRFAFAIA
jgi:hypothetical protein